MGSEPAPCEVVALHVAKGRRLPMREVPHVEAEAGAGLVGDRYHGSRHRHLTVQAADELADAAARLGAPVPASGTRRNVTVSRGPLPRRPGERVWLGEVLLEVVRPAAPCRVLDDEIGPGAARALHDRAGTVFRILTSGTIRLGDTCRPVPQEGPPDVG